MELEARLLLGLRLPLRLLLRERLLMLLLRERVRLRLPLLLLLLRQCLRLRLRLSLRLRLGLSLLGCLLRASLRRCRRCRRSRTVTRADLQCHVLVRWCTAVLALRPLSPPLRLLPLRRLRGLLLGRLLLRQQRLLVRLRPGLRLRLRLRPGLHLRREEAGR